MKRIIVLILAALASAPVWAHTGHEGSGLFAGLVHPFQGADHLLAMLAVGLWAGSLGGRTILNGPATFVAAMLAGFALALGGIALPVVEPGIALSVLVLGLLVAFAVKVRPVHALPVIALFAIWHGYAHGAEMAGGAVAYALGMLLSTAALHLTGVGIGHVTHCKVSRALQVAGGAIAAVGGFMLGGLI
jgi:urease accessory protein